MGLFSKKKRELPERNLPEFPRFPEPPRPYPQGYPSSTTFPTYESEFKREETQERMPESSPRLDIQPKQVNEPQREPEQQEQRRAFWGSEQRQEQMPEKREQTYTIEQPKFPRPEFVPEEKPYRVASPPPFTRFEQDVWKPQRQEPQNEQQFQKERPAIRQEQSQVEERPVFVKIQQYREAMSSIETLRQKLKEVENILDKLSQLRSQEQVEITNCQSNINKIKEKLIEVDKKLFEV